MRQGMLLARATHSETAGISVVNSWIKDHGLDSPLQLTDDEAMEEPRRVHVTVEAATSFTKKKKKSLDGESSEEKD